MADYWKSQPRKFCQYCKCWIADNKPSIEFHERGKNHKENVAAKIAEIKKKSVAKAKQEKRMSKEFAAMEEAAIKAYEEDVKRMEAESRGIILPQVQKLAHFQPQVQVKVPGKSEKKHSNSKPKGRGKAPAHRHADVWVEGLTDEGVPYFYNTQTGESRWERPVRPQRAATAGRQTTAGTEPSPACPWVEAVTPEGYPYYYNAHTGGEYTQCFHCCCEKPASIPLLTHTESTWDKPEGYLPQIASSAGGGAQQDTSKTARKEEGVVQKDSSDPSEPTKESEQATSSNVPENKEETVDAAEGEVEAEKSVEKESSPAAPVWRPRRVNPYGEWEKVKQLVDPYEKVDLQLPRIETSGTSSPPHTPEQPPEPKVKFKERTITSLGEPGEGGAVFKKRKVDNGKARSIRQREEDD